MARDPGRNRLTFAEFLAWEARQEAKHEFVDGRIFAFAGGTLRLAAIAGRVYTKIAPATPCLTLGSDAMIQTARGGRYADLVVTCDERDRLDERVVRYPKLIVEVLSESTEANDRGPKMDEYRALGTLDEYVLIDSRERWAQTVRRVRGEWVISLPITSGEVTFTSVGLTMTLDELYPAETATSAAETDAAEGRST
jgi:Uma2 family endonuclease